MSLQIKPECFAETYLCHYLGYKKVDHSQPSGIAQVFKKLRNTNKTPLIGIIDNDKSKPRDFKNYQIIDPHTLDSRSSQPHKALTYYKHKEYDLYIILQEPDFEGWIFNIAKSNKLLPRNGKLNSVKELKKITKQRATRIHQNQELKQIFDQIDKLPHSPFEEIRSFISRIL